MTDSQYEAWLADLSARRVLLAELHHAGGIEYVATGAFISRPTDSAPNRAYHDILRRAIDISTRIDGLIGFGEIELIDNGEITHWVDHAWHGHPVKLYLGSPDWPLDDFRLHTQARNGGISEARRGVLSFAVEDESSVLDQKIDTGELPDGSGPVPLALGSVYNAPAYLLQPDPYEFKASYLAVTELTPKDNGYPVAHTDNLANGSFELTEGLAGTLTVDIEEQHNTPASICQWVADYYGIALSEASLPAYTVGMYFNQQTTGRALLDELCEGLGAYWYLDALGGLVVRQHQVATAADATLVSDQIAFDKIRLAETQPPWGGLTLRYRRNYSTLSTVAGGVDDTEAAQLRNEWRESSASQDVSYYPLAEDADRAERNSIIQLEADAITERDRLLSLRGIRRDVWSIEAFMPPVQAGMSLAVEHPRLAGRVGRVTSVSRSPTRSLTSLELWL
ncbi:hypothetical protein [Halomonas elongata]|uniref:hypothetical protein n=1 Tax=Halomonas elongata TaxID=2746 RepID=UPI00186B73ED|nr:hypothetical protein [Halomonas elongata]MBW5801199.1 hypothetical protein [Halomonas elongata]